MSQSLRPIGRKRHGTSARCKSLRSWNTQLDTPQAPRPKSSSQGIPHSQTRRQLSFETSPEADLDDIVPEFTTDADLRPTSLYAEIPSSGFVDPDETLSDDANVNGGLIDSAEEQSSALDDAQSNESFLKSEFALNLARHRASSHSEPTTKPTRQQLRVFNELVMQHGYDRALIAESMGVSLDMISVMYQVDYERKRGKVTKQPKPKADSEPTRKKARTKIPSVQRAAELKHLDSKEPHGEVFDTVLYSDLQKLSELQRLKVERQFELQARSISTTSEKVSFSLPSDVASDPDFPSSLPDMDFDFDTGVPPESAFEPPELIDDGLALHNQLTEAEYHAIKPLPEKRLIMLRKRAMVR